MLAGIVRAARMQDRAKVQADRLLTRLKQSRLRRFDDSVVKLIGEVGEFLEIWLAGQPAEQVEQVAAQEPGRQGADTRADTADKRYTTEQALLRFVSRINGIPEAQVLIPTIKQRQRSIQAAERSLAQDGI